MIEVIGRSKVAILLIGGTNFLATNSEFDTASALGSNSPKNNVIAVRKAVTKPKLKFGNNCINVATNNAVEYIEHAVVVNSIVVNSMVISFDIVANGDDSPSSEF